MHTLSVNNSWKDPFNGDTAQLQAFTNEVLPAYLRTTRWFGAKSSSIKHYKIDYLMPYPISAREMAYILFVEVVFQTSNTETYFLPVTAVRQIEDERGTICQVSDRKGNTQWLVDAIYTNKFRNSLFANIISRKRMDLNVGMLRFSKGKRLKSTHAAAAASKVLSAEQSNSTIVYADRYYLKVYRKLFRNNNPDLELTRFLSEKAGYPYSPHFAGSIEWVRADYYTVSLGLMQEKVENQGEAWGDTLQEIEKYFGRVEASGLTPNELPKVELYKPLAIENVPPILAELVGPAMLEKTKKLAIRTAELHLALASDRTDRAFSPDAFTGDYTVWLLNRVMYMYDRRFHLLEQNLSKLKGEAREYANYFVESKDRIKDRLLNFNEQQLNSCRIRIHGDYHLGQVLLTGNDFCILDFEGEPESTIRDRKVKQPPIKDLAGLFRSYHYAVFATVFQRNKSKLNPAVLTEAGGRYYRLIVAVSLHYYCKTAIDGGLNIGYPKEIDFLLRYHLFEKAIYELGYELHARPDWVVIPLKGIMQILNNE
jgi:maltose alpha-D-glucosyltransferase/alpha-amylase